MVLRPEDIEQREFGSALRGFDKAEVRAFLRRVAGEVRYLESEVEAVKDSSSDTTERPAADLELPRIDTRPPPPVLAPLPDDLPPRDLPDLGAPGSQLPEPVAPEPVAPVPETSSGTPSIEHEADRFGALGDRIANLLRNAQETAEQVRRQADSDAAQTRAEAAAAGVELRTSADHYAAETRAEAAAEAEELRSSAQVYSTEVRSSADADAASMRAAAEEALASAQAEAAEIREHALADANEMRTQASAELDAARTEAATALREAETEVVTLRQQAIDDGVATLSGREAVIAQQEAEVAAEREQALAELADARSQVSTLLQEARAQSEFIRQESEEIIRTKVRANMEQAQKRIDMLRTTETASKDRIAAARKELESALARLDAEPAPGLPAGTEDLVLEEAHEAASGNRSLVAPTPDSSEAVDAGFIDVETVGPDTDRSTGSEAADLDEVAIETGQVGGFDASLSQTLADELQTPDADPSVERSESVDPAAVSTEGHLEAEIVDVAEATTHAPEFAADGAAAPEAPLVDLPSPDTIAPPPPPPGFGDDFVDPGVGQTVHGGSFFGSRGSEATEDIPPPPPPPPGFEAPVGIDAPVFDSVDTTATPPAADVDPLEGLMPDDEADHDADSSTTGEAPTAAPVESVDDQIEVDEAPSDAPVADINTPENEDALAKLVREAMQRAVDSARGNQN